MTSGEIEIRGPWVAASYYESPIRPIAGPPTAGSALAMSPL